LDISAEPRSPGSRVTPLPEDHDEPDRREQGAESSLMAAEERAQVNAYHARVFEVISHDVPLDVRAWLKGACAPL